MARMQRLSRWCLVLLALNCTASAQTIIQQYQQGADSIQQTQNQRKQAEKSGVIQSPPIVQPERLPSGTSLYGPYSQDPHNDQSELKETLEDEPIPAQPNNKPRPVPDQSASSRSGPNEAYLWRLYDRHEFAVLDARIKLYGKRFPGWKPPAKLLRLSAERRKLRLLDRAYSGANWNSIIVFARRNPNFFNCDRINEIWILAEAYAKTHQLSKAEHYYDYIVQRCDGDDMKIATLQKARKYLDGAQQERLWSSIMTHLDRPQSRASLQRIRYAFSKDRFIKLYETKPKHIDSQLISRFADGVNRYRDAAAANLIGWYFLNLDDNEKARDWFIKSTDWSSENEPENREASYGLALAYRKLGELNQAQKIAQRISNQSDRAHQLFAEILVQRAWIKIEQREYAKARDLAMQALDLNTDDRSAKSVLAWVDYHEENFDQATNLFKELYDQAPSAELARGWALSIAALDPDELPDLADSNRSGLLGEQINARYGQELYWRRHFLAAYDRSREIEPGLKNIDSPWVSGGVLFRYKSGDKGMNRLDTAFIPIVQAVYFHKRVHRFALTVDSMHLDSKTPSACAPIGSLPVQLTCSTRNVAVAHQPGSVTVTSGPLLQQDLTTQLNGGESIALSYQRDGWNTPYVRIGTTPIGGVISPRPTLQAGFLSEMRDGRWGMELYSLPVRESILSYSGMRDPYSDRKWGRVLRSGAKTSLLIGLGNQWTLTGQLDFAALYGEAVKTNWTGAASIGVGYDLKLEGFDYFSVGPEISFQHFDQNQNHFTLGHGGYFSPEHFLNTGVGLHFLTREGRSFVFQGRIALGYQNFRDAAAPWFPVDSSVQNVPSAQVSLDGQPLFSTTPFYNGNSQDGIAHDFEFKGVWLAHPHFQLGGGIAARKTSGYDDYSTGLFVRFLFEPRRASYSSDIPRYLFQKFY